MDELTFIIELIKALVWPVTALTVLFYLRKPLAGLIPLLQRVRYRDIELDFGKKVQELAQESKKELPQPAEKEARRRLSDYVAQLARLSPRAVVLEAWIELEEAAIEASKRRGIDLSSREQRSPIVLGNALEEAGVLDANKAIIFHRLRNLRNAATHAAEFALDPDAALEYADVALRLTDYLRQA